MAQTNHSAMFFVGDLYKTTRRFAKMTLRVCRRHLRNKYVALINDNDLERKEHEQCRDSGTFFVYGAPRCELQIPFLYDFKDGAVIVHIDFRGDSTVETVQPILDQVKDIPIIRLIEREEEDDARLLWILNKLTEIDRAPLPTEVIRRVIADEKALSKVTSHLPARALQEAA